MRDLRDLGRRQHSSWTSSPALRQMHALLIGTPLLGNVTLGSFIGTGNISAETINLGASSGSGTISLDNADTGTITLNSEATDRRDPSEHADAECQLRTSTLNPNDSITFTLVGQMANVTATQAGNTANTFTAGTLSCPGGVGQATRHTTVARHLHDHRRLDRRPGTCSLPINGLGGMSSTRDHQHLTEGHVSKARVHQSIAFVNKLPVLDLHPCRHRRRVRRRSRRDVERVRWPRANLDRARSRCSFRIDRRRLRYGGPQYVSASVVSRAFVGTRNRRIRFSIFSAGSKNCTTSSLPAGGAARLRSSPPSSATRS